MPSNFQNTQELLIDARMTVGVEASNVISVDVQLVDRLNGNTIGESVALNWYLSSSATGAAIATAPDSGAALSNGYGALAEWTANVNGLVITNSNGRAIFTLSESSTGTWYLVLVMPDGKLMVSDAITFA